MGNATLTRSIVVSESEPKLELLVGEICARVGDLFAESETVMRARYKELGHSVKLRWRWTVGRVKFYRWIELGWINGSVMPILGSCISNIRLIILGLGH